MKFHLPTINAELGVTIDDVDLRAVLTSSDVETLRNNWTKYGVAIFPNQHLTLEQYENFSQL
ncbi:MAG: hypothetical protein ACKVID_06180, partial [Gammaproteobacteria bacterium]